MGSFSPISAPSTTTTLSINVSDVIDRDAAEEFVVYRDLNQESSGKDPMLVNMDAVAQALSNLFNTRPGERIFRPNFGSDLEAILFQPIDEATTLRLKQLLIKSVEQWEPRVRVDRRLTEITPQPDDNGYDIFIIYQILGIPEEYFEFQGFYEIIG